MAGEAVPVRSFANSRRRFSTVFCILSLRDFSSSMAWLLPARDQGSDFLAAGGLRQVSGHVHVKHQDGNVVFPAQSESGSVHDLELPVDGLGVGDGLVAHRVFVLVGIL